MLQQRVLGWVQAYTWNDIGKDHLMNRKSLLLTVVLTLASLGWAQTESAPAQAPPPKGRPGQMGMEHHHKMTEMHKQHMEAMKADVDKMKASLEQLKANVAKISDSAEKARWQANVDMWTVMVGHMEQMSKHMDAMGPGGMMGHDMMHHGHEGGPPVPPPPAAPKPQ
jgi:predicted metal-binding membrane protein